MSKLLQLLLNTLTQIYVRVWGWCFDFQVYEHIVFDGREHVSIVSFPGMKERTIVTSSLSKTFSVTGMVFFPANYVIPMQ